MPLFQTFQKFTFRHLPNEYNLIINGSLLMKLCWNKIKWISHQMIWKSTCHIWVEKLTSKSKCIDDVTQGYTLLNVLIISIVVGRLTSCIVHLSFCSRSCCAFYKTRQNNGRNRRLCAIQSNEDANIYGYGFRRYYLRCSINFLYDNFNRLSF